MAGPFMPVTIIFGGTAGLYAFESNIPGEARLKNYGDEQWCATLVD